MDVEVAAAHEAGHWSALHAVGIEAVGVGYSGIDPAPACTYLRSGPAELSLHDRRLVGFAGVAGEQVALGRRDYWHWAADAAWWLPEVDYGDDPEGRAIDLLNGQRAAFLAVFDDLRARFAGGTPLCVPTATLRNLAVHAGAALGWYLRDPRFEQRQ